MTGWRSGGVTSGVTLDDMLGNGRVCDGLGLAVVWTCVRGGRGVVLIGSGAAGDADDERGAGVGVGCAGGAATDVQAAATSTAQSAPTTPVASTMRRRRPRQPIWLT